MTKEFEWFDRGIRDVTRREETELERGLEGKEEMKEREDRLMYVQIPSHFTLMLQSLEWRQRTDESASITFYERRVVVRSGSIEIVTFSTQDNPRISQ
jgi:hypothetical protein